MDITYFLEKKNGSRIKPKSLNKENPELYNSIIEYGKLNNIVVPFKELIWFYLNKETTKPKCCECGGDTVFERISSGYRSFCSKTCKSSSDITKNKITETFLLKYGGHPMTNDEVKEKTKKTNLEKYGYESHLSSEVIKTKIENTNLEKYGVKRPLESSIIQNKTKETMITKYGVEHGLQSNDIHKKTMDTIVDRNWDSVIDAVKNTKQKKYGNEKYNNMNKNRETCIKKYGVDNVFKSPEFRGKISETRLTTSLGNYKYGDKIKILNIGSDVCSIECSDCGMVSDVGRRFMMTRGNSDKVMCLTCNPYGTIYTSATKEIELFFDGENVTKNDRSVLGGLEIDLLFIDKGVGVEYNGVYWHNELYKDRNYHLHKTKLASESNIRLIHVFEDEWKHKQDIVKSILNHQLTRTTNRVYARKCDIREITAKESKIFLDENHIQGNVNSKIKIGLFYNDSLVSVMTFGGSRIVLASKSEEGSYEMLRFCNKLNTVVIGGSDKLFSFFVKKYKPKNVVSYSDNRWFTGVIYEKLGFTYVGDTPPNYWYVVNNKRYHRYNFRKDKLVRDGFDPNLSEREIMFNRGIYRIYDCGNKKWLWKDNN